MARTKLRSGSGVGPRVEQPEEKATPSEVRAQVETAANLIALGFSREQVLVALEAEHGLPPKIAERRVSVAWSEIRASYKQPLEDHRVLQHARILHGLARARAAGKHAAVARYEEVLMRLLGTAQPIKVRVDVPSEERERLLNVMLLLPGSAIGQILAGEERVALGHTPRTFEATAEESGAEDTPSPDAP